EVGAAASGRAAPQVARLDDRLPAGDHTVADHLPLHQDARARPALAVAIAVEGDRQDARRLVAARARHPKGQRATAADLAERRDERAREGAGDRDPAFAIAPAAADEAQRPGGLAVRRAGGGDGLALLQAAGGLPVERASPGVVGDEPERQRRARGGGGT